MKVYTGEFIQSILNQIPKQNNHEKHLTVYPFTKYHKTTLDFQSIQFEEHCCCYCPIPLDKVFGTATIDDVLYILFKNLTLHILYQNAEHDVLQLQSPSSKIEKAKMRLNHLLDKRMN